MSLISFTQPSELAAQLRVEELKAAATTVSEHPDLEAMIYDAFTLGYQDGYGAASEQALAWIKRRIPT